MFVSGSDLALPAKSPKFRVILLPPGTFSTPDARYDHVHLGLVGPLPVSFGYRYLLTCIDRFTHWPETIHLQDISAATVACALYPIGFQSFGVPSTISTYRGAQFESSFFHSLAALLGSVRIRTTAYHPCANGMVKRFYRTLKASLKAQPDTSNWTGALPLFFCICAQPSNRIRTALLCTRTLKKLYINK